MGQFIEFIIKWLRICGRQLIVIIIHKIYLNLQLFKKVQIQQRSGLNIKMDQSNPSELRLPTLGKKSKSQKPPVPKIQIDMLEDEHPGTDRESKAAAHQERSLKKDHHQPDGRELLVKTPDNKDQIVDHDFFSEFNKDRQEEQGKLSAHRRSLRKNYRKAKQLVLEKQQSEKSSTKLKQSIKKLAFIVSPKNSKNQETETQPLNARDSKPDVDSHRSLLNTPKDSARKSSARKLESESVEPFIKNEDCGDVKEFCNDHSHPSARSQQPSSGRTNELELLKQQSLQDKLQRKLSLIRMQRSNLKISIKDQDIRTGNEEDYEEHFKKKTCCGRLKDRFTAFKLINEMIKLFDSLNEAAQWQKFFSQSVEQESAKRTIENEKTFKKYKNYSYIPLICLLPVIIATYAEIMEQLGKIKSLTLRYFKLSNLVYDIEDVPELLPVHYFTFFDANEIKDRIRCVYQSNTEIGIRECMKKNMKACKAKGLTTLEYEQCVISLIDSNRDILTSGRRLNEVDFGVPTNSTQFCMDHYNNDELWTGELSNIFLQFYIQKHDCLEFAGVSRGREFCTDYKDHDSSWGKVQLYDCFQTHGVWDAKEYCDDMFGYQNDDFDGGVQLLQCYGNNKIPKGEEFCVNTFRGQQKEELDKRIKCFNEIGLENRLVCETKYNSTNTGVDETGQLLGFNFDKPLYRDCIDNLNLTRDKDFCDLYFESNQPWEIDLRFQCYEMIGLDIQKDRVYCELKNPQNSTMKYECVDQLGLPRGGDYCYIKFPYDDKYDELYQCLEREGVPYNSQYCEEKFHHIEGLMGDEFNPQDKYDCFEQYGIEQTELDCKEVRNTPRGMQLELGQATIVEYEVSHSIKEDRSKKYSVREFDSMTRSTLINSNQMQFLGYLFNFHNDSQGSNETVTHNVWIIEEGWQDYLNQTMPWADNWHLWGQIYDQLESNLKQSPTLQSSYGLFVYWNETGVKSQQKLNERVQFIYEDYELFLNPFVGDADSEGGQAGSGDDAAENSIFLSEPEPDPMSTYDLFVAVIGSIEEFFPKDFQDDLISMLSTDDGKNPTGYMITMMQQLKSTEDYNEKSTAELFIVNNQQGKIGELSEAYNQTKTTFAYKDLMERKLDFQTLLDIRDYINSTDGVFNEIFKLYKGPQEQPMITKLVQEIGQTALQEPFYFGYFKEVMGQKPYYQYFVREFQNTIAMNFKDFNATIWGENMPEEEQEPPPVEPSPYINYEGTVVTIVLDYDYHEFMSSNQSDVFIKNMSESLNLNDQYIKILEVQEGSVIITYQLLPCETNCSKFDPEDNAVIITPDYAEIQKDLLATNQVDFGSPVIGIQVEGGETIVKDGVIVAEGYENKIITRTEENADLSVDDDGVIIESIVWSSVESVDVTSKLENYNNKAASQMKWCARESGICICPWGNTVGFGLRNLTLWERWRPGDTEADFIQLDNTLPYMQINFEYNVTECSSRVYGGFDPDPNRKKDCFCMNFVDENAGNRQFGDRYGTDTNFTESEKYFIDKKETLGSQDAIFCSALGEICTCPDSNEAYLAYQNDTTFRVDGTYQMDTENPSVSVKNRYAFICNPKVFGQPHVVLANLELEIESDESRVLSCFCQLKQNTFNTASLQSRIMSANVYHGLFDKLKNNRLFMKFIEQLFYKKPGQTRPSNNKFSSFVRQDLDFIVRRDCNGRNFDEAPGILLDEWIRSSTTLQNIIMDFDDLMRNSTLGTIHERDLANILDSGILLEYHPFFQINLLFEIGEIFGEVPAVSQYLSQTRENGGLFNLNEIFELFMNMGVTDSLFQGLMFKRYEENRSDQCANAAELRAISNQITSKPATQSLFNGYFANFHDEKTIQIRQDLISTAIDDCVQRNFIFDQTKFINQWIKRSVDLQSILVEVESTIDSDQFSFMKGKMVSQYTLPYLLQDLGHQPVNLQIMQWFEGYKSQAPVLQGYVQQALQLVDDSPSFSQLIQILSQTKATGEVFQELFMSDQKLVNQVTCLVEENMHASIEEKLKYQSIILRLEETIPERPIVSRGVDRFYNIDDYENDNFMFEFVKQGLKDALSQSKSIKQDQGPPKCNLREAVDIMIKNTYYLQTLIMDFEYIFEQSGLLLFDKTSMDKIIFNEFIDDFQLAGYRTFKQQFDQLLETKLPSLNQLFEEQRDDKPFREYEQLMDWEQILGELIENTDEFKSIPCQDDQLLQESDQMRTPNNNRRQLISNDENTNTTYQIGTWLFEGSETIVGQLLLNDSVRFRVSRLPYWADMDTTKVNLQFENDRWPQNNIDFNYTLDNETDTFKLMQARENNLVSKTVKNTILKSMGELEVYPNVSCHFSGQWPGAGEYPWIKIYLNETLSVKFINIFNIKNGQYTSLLEDAEIIIEDSKGIGPSVKCAQVGSRLPVYENLKFECKDETSRTSLFDDQYEEQDDYEGAKGDVIRIQATKSGVLVLCDIEVYAAVVDQNFEAQLQRKLDECDRLENQCYEKEPKENKWNCLERYGVEKTAEMCKEIQQVTSDKFFYPLKNKYECLTDPDAEFEQVDVSDEVISCLDLYFEYQVEQCLFQIENPLSGPNPQDQTYRLLQEASQTLTLALEDDREESIEDIPTELIRTFLCDNSKMLFYTNPYHFVDKYHMNDDTTGEIKIDLKCEAFELIDDITQKELVAIHNYFPDDFEIQSTQDKLLNETKFYINKTDLNEQYFQISYQKNMEYINIKKSLFYKVKHGEVNNTVLNDEDFRNLRFSQSTIKLLESQSSEISNTVPVPIVLVADPVTTYHEGEPNRTGLTVLDYPFTYFNRVDKQFQIKPENNPLPVEYLTEEQRSQNEFHSFIYLNFRFTLSNYTITYFIYSDAGADLGGISNIVGSLFASMQTLIIILFFVWFVYQVKEFTEDQFRMVQIKQERQNLEAYREYINDFDSDDDGYDPKMKKDKVFIDKILENMMQYEQEEVIDDIIENETEKEKKAREKLLNERQEEERKAKVNKEFHLLKSKAMKFIEKPKNELELAEEREINQQLAQWQDQDFCCMTAKEIQTRLDRLERTYGSKIQKENKYLDDWHMVKTFYSRIQSTPFIQLCDRVKTKVSFFNIQHFSYEIGLLQRRLKYTKESIPGITDEFIKVLNKLKFTVNLDTLALKLRGQQVLSNIRLPSAVNKQNSILNLVRKDIKETQELAEREIKRTYVKQMNSKDLSKKYLVQAKEVLAKRQSQRNSATYSDMDVSQNSSFAKEIAMVSRSGARTLQAKSNNKVGKGKYAIGLQQKKANEFTPRLNMAQRRMNEQNTHRKSLLQQPLRRDTSVPNHNSEQVTARFERPLSDMLFSNATPTKKILPNEQRAKSPPVLMGDYQPSKVISTVTLHSSESVGQNECSVVVPQLLVNPSSPISGAQSSAQHSYVPSTNIISPLNLDAVYQNQFNQNANRPTLREDVRANAHRVANQSPGIQEGSQEDVMTPHYDESDKFEESYLGQEEEKEPQLEQLDLDEDQQSFVQDESLVQDVNMNEGSTVSKDDAKSGGSEETIRVNVNLIGKQNQRT